MATPTRTVIDMDDVAGVGYVTATIAETVLASGQVAYRILQEALVNGRQAQNDDLPAIKAHFNCQ